MTDPLGQSQVIPYLAGLTKHDIRFTLISFEKKEAFARSGVAVQKQLDKLNIRWIPLSYTKNPPVLSTVFDIWKLRRTVARLLRDHTFDIVHCRSYITALVGVWAKKKFGVRFLFDMRGLWADERVDGRLWNLGNPLYRLVYRFFKKRELDFLLQADHTISLTQAAKREILSWPALQDKKVPISVIPCCVDTELFAPERISPERLAKWRSKTGIEPGDPVLSYVGSIGTWYMLDAMLAFFHEWRKQVPSARFLFITRGEHERIRQAAARYGIQDALIIQAADRADVPVLLSLSRWSVFFILPAYSKIASSPTKQGEIMAMGIPVICNPGVGDTDAIVQQFNSGYLADPNHPEPVIQAMTADASVFSPEAIKAGAHAYFSLEKGVSEYLSVYRQLLPRTGL